MVIIADTSCLIVLRKLNRLHLLRDLYGTILVTGVVSQEYGSALPEWFLTVSSEETLLLTELNEKLDRGEASAIALASTTPDCLLIIDELKGRTIAQELAIPLIGTLGVLVKAKEANLIDSIKELLTAMRLHTDFRFLKAVEAAVLRKAGE